MAGHSPAMSATNVRTAGLLTWLPFWTDMDATITHLMVRTAGVWQELINIDCYFVFWLPIGIYSGIGIGIYLLIIVFMTSRIVPCLFPLPVLSFDQA